MRESCRVNVRISSFLPIFQTFSHANTGFNTLLKPEKHAFGYFEDIEISCCPIKKIIVVDSPTNIFQSRVSRIFCVGSGMKLETCENFLT